MKIACFDTETTGLPLHPSVPLDQQPRITEFAAVIVDTAAPAPEAWEYFSTLVNPGIPLTAEITKITGLTTEMLRDCPPWADVAERVRRLFEAGVEGVVAHNLPFDRRMVDMEFARLDAPQLVWPERAMCTAAEHAALWGYRPRLLDLYEHVCGTRPRQQHRALADAKLLAEIVCRAELWRAWR